MYIVSVNLKHCKYILFITLLLSASLWPCGSYAVSSGETVNELIRSIVSSEGHLPDFSLGGEPLYVKSMLKRFYSRRNHKPAWISEEGQFSDAELLIQTIEEVSIHGLVPEYYHLAALRDLMKERKGPGPVSPELVVELDLLLTDAFLMLGCHFSAGCVDPVTIEAEWFANRDDLEIDYFLEDALQANTIKDTLKELLPPQSGYRKLLSMLAQYRNIVQEGGWPEISTVSILKKGDRGKDVLALRKRMRATDEISDLSTAEVEVFDSELEKAVLNFQARHGLKQDGKAGPDTIGEMNVSAGKRLDQIEVNLERMRWLSRNLGHRYILVNIADYTLTLVENGKTQMAMEVIVGKPFWYTPVFSDIMKYIVLNPSWKVPDSIAKKEIFPELRKNPAYLVEKNLKVVSSWSDAAEYVDTSDLDWKNTDFRQFKHKFRQDPGDDNPLGRVKFVFPNKFNIYLHDTPAKSLFAIPSRAFSHGCIRISKPRELVEYLLKESPEWDRAKIDAVIKTGELTRVDLVNPMVVNIVYMTAWVDEGGILQFRKDIYERDSKLKRALIRKPAIKQTVTSRK
ncbi:L,D-transpeptidase family protein [bacterium]|nr:L,D-transpeptidase family protein [bacterium]